MKARKPIRVGVDVHHYKMDRKGRQTEFKYSYNHLNEIIKKNLKKPWDGWVDCTIGLPNPFDLQSVRVKNCSKIKNGWWNGTEWDGLRIEPTDKILEWRWKGEGHYD